MDEFREKLLRRLVFRPDSLSRNKYFSAFDEPEMKRIRRVARHLRGILDTLGTTPLRYVSLQRAAEGTWQIGIESPEAHASRTITVQESELALLCDHPAAMALRRLRARATRG